MSEPSNGRLSLEAIQTLCHQEGWQAQPLLGKEGYALQFSMAHGLLTCQIEFLSTREELLITVDIPGEAKPPLQSAIVEFMNRVNVGILLGGFEMNLNDGFMRFKQGLSFKSAPFPLPMLRAACIHAVQTTDLYLPGITAILYGGQNAAEAVKIVVG